jgi:hypothetical protein
MRRRLVPGVNKQTIENAGNLPEQRPDPFRALWNLDVKELLNCERVAKLVCHWEGVGVIGITQYTGAYSWKHSPDGQSKAGLECKFCTRSTSLCLCAEDRCALEESQLSTVDNPGQPRTGSARRISSPLSSKMSLSTPCAAGCWGLEGWK